MYEIHGFGIRPVRGLGRFGPLGACCRLLSPMVAPARIRGGACCDRPTAMESVDRCRWTGAGGGACEIESSRRMSPELEEEEEEEGDMGFGLLSSDDDDVRHSQTCICVFVCMRV